MGISELVWGILSGCIPLVSGYGVLDNIIFIHLGVYAVMGYTYKIGWGIPFEMVIFRCLLQLLGVYHHR